MSEEEKEAIEQLKSWREFIINNKDKVNKANELEFYLRTALNLIQRQENLLNKVKEEAYDHIRFENRLKRDNIEPDLFNQGRFYVANNIKNILKGEDK